LLGRRHGAIAKLVGYRNPSRTVLSEIRRQIVKPYIHVEDANGNPYVGAKLYVYVPGTTTLAAIYADAALSVPLPNPLAGVTGSDAAGNFPRAYIAAGAYKPE